MKTDIFFLHGLDSSGSGTKGRFLAENFPQVKRPDFSGSLAARLAHFAKLCQVGRPLLLVGSSYGGLMATCHAISHPQSVVRLLLLAPALNYENYQPPPTPLTIPTVVVIGRHDTVTPPDLVVPLAKATFANLEIRLEDDDHMLHQTFTGLDWQKLLTPP